MDFFSPPSADDRLLRQAAQGQAQALSQLVRRHQALAYTVALRVVGNRQDAEEVVQDAFLKAFTGLSEFRRAAKFSTWLYRIVYNTALSKKRSRPPLVDLPPEADPVMEPTATADGWEAVRRADQRKYLTLALARLPPEDALVLTLHYLGEQSIAELCVILDKKTSAVKMQLLRSRKQLEQALTDLLPTEFKHLL
ncbi:RNA polymerase sigma factor [Hymenobacter rigui]|uniref:RNA polymerase sigma factor n=1 Tax=Hymenobacter rigui TaxID=334424 RepID=A0A3R9MXG4_9BACT|nr:sigma-70 family RNA polymerase sigma factor [Hymenobacter rigui]RSK43158.1 sigma-70 family RNA polymerase sigma factor [Hymenobacter rigui]